MAQEDKKKKFIKASSDGAKDKDKKTEGKKKRSVKEVRKAMYGDEGVD